jgi:hypothetical protein
MERPKNLGTPYNDMSRQQKVRFVMKLVVCILTFGIVFPNVMGD